MTTDFLYDFISRHRYAVMSSVSEEGNPESALVGFAAAPDLKLIFDTVFTTRKYKNLIQNRSIALVIGWENEQTVQYEGRVIFQSGNEFNKMQQLYFNAFPEGKLLRETRKDIAYFVVVPDWIRYSDYNEPQRIEEINFLSDKLKYKT